MARQYKTEMGHAITGPGRRMNHQLRRYFLDDGATQFMRDKNFETFLQLAGMGV
jgi:hypothetical protein